ncbi:MAG TPA: hypothetical protein VMI54_02200 [Polyangiaceae bacterium]|nr:hypothetical protein [Polyangiaceae bacterium]
MTRLARSGSLLVVALGLGCASEKERPPPPTCLGDCGLSPGIGTGVSMPGGSAGAQGEGGADAGTPQGVVLTGDVLVLNDDLDFMTGTPLTDTANIQTDGADGRPVTGTWDGINPFVLTNVAAARPVWVLATPPNGTADDALPALEPVRTDAPDANDTVTANLALVHATTIDHIFALASVPLTTDATLGQVILLLESKPVGATTPSPLAGVTAQSSSAQGVIYAASGSFSDVATTTDNTGVVVLANVAGAAWPGAVINVLFSGAKTSGAQVRVVSGAVTIATIEP